MHFEVKYCDANKNICRNYTSDQTWQKVGTKFLNRQLGLAFCLETETTSNGMRYSLPMPKMEENGDARFLSIIPLDTASVRNDCNGAILLPIDSGILCYAKDKPSEEYTVPVFAEKEWKMHWSNMPLWGAISNGKASMAIVESGKFDFAIRLRTNWLDSGIYTADPEFFIRDYWDDEPLREDIVFIVMQINGGYLQMAHAYRKYNLEQRKLPTLKMKAKENPALDHASRSLPVRCRLAVKPLPPAILEQTQENEPEARVLMSLEHIVEVAQAFKDAGVGECEFNLVGWNHGGHDGAFPQLFPVEASIGGEPALLDAVNKVQALGFPVSLHDNYVDGTSLARNFDLDDYSCEHMENDMRLPFPSVSGELACGRSYRICPQRAAERYAKENFKLIKEKLPVSGAYYVDVISIIMMRKCYHPTHSVSRSDNARYYKDIMRMMQENFQVAMSEGARDWCLPELDRAYMVFNNLEKDLPYCDCNVPFFELVYHGFIIYNTLRSGINAWPGERAYLMNFAWGGIPLVYFHHLFNPNWSPEHGWSLDLTYENPEKLRRDTQTIKRITDDIDKVEHLRYEFIEEIIEHSADLSETRYANGASVWVNYSPETRLTSSGIRIPQRDFIVID